MQNKGLKGFINISSIAPNVFMPSICSVKFSGAKKISSAPNASNDETIYKKPFCNEKKAEPKVFYEGKDGKLISAKPFETDVKDFCAENFLNAIRYENPQKKYVTICKDYKFPQEMIAPNKEAQAFIRVLDNLNLEQKKEFIQAFCNETGFPNLSFVRKNMEAEITENIHSMAQKNNFDVKFVGYDSNCSVGKNTAYPGSDCDALFVIIDTKGDKTPWFAGQMRWEFKDNVNQRILSTPAGSLPELLSTDFIEDGLKIADSAYMQTDFNEDDLRRFCENLYDNSKDFVKAAEFNIELAGYLPENSEIRDKFYKTAMFVELFREGQILENNFSKEFSDKIKKSPLYKYSNIIRQCGLKSDLKEKHKKRIETAEKFHKMSTKVQFQLILDMIKSSLYMNDTKSSELFANVDSSGNDEMGNIFEMYDMLSYYKH